MAAIASQLYYIEIGKEINPDQLARMLPTVIPDSCLAGPGMIERWMEMVIASFRRVRERERERERNSHASILSGYFCSCAQHNRYLLGVACTNIIILYLISSAVITLTVY